MPRKKNHLKRSVAQLRPVLGIPKSYFRNKFNFQTQRKNVYIRLLYITTAEISDISDIAQLLMFIRGIYLNFIVFEELAELYNVM